MNKEYVFPKGGCLVFFGDIFGGRYGDNYHQIINYSYDIMQGVIRIIFNEGETCTIYNPSNISYSKTAFVIEEASRIIWEWYYYGREKTIENLNRIEYEKIDAACVVKTRTGNLGSGRTNQCRADSPALQFI